MSMQLGQARAWLDRAIRAQEEAESHYEETGEPVPWSVKNEVREATQRLHEIEQKEIESARRRA